MTTYVIPWQEMLQRAQAMRDQAQTIQNEINRINQTVEALDWMGQWAEAFFGDWENNARPAMQEMVTTLNQLADDLEAQAAAARDVDMSRS
jgi:WXG100 family type VII secretion target